MAHLRIQGKSETNPADVQGMMITRKIDTEERTRALDLDGRRSIVPADGLTKEVGVNHYVQEGEGKRQ